MKSASGIPDRWPEMRIMYDLGSCSGRIISEQANSLDCNYLSKYIFVPIPAVVKTSVRVVVSAAVRILVFGCISVDAYTVLVLL